GMIDESMDEEYKNQEPQPWEFRSKPAWQRFIVMIGGIVMNVLLGILIFAFYLNTYEKAYLPPENITHGIYAYPSAQEFGFQTGDKITHLNGKEVKRFSDLVSMKVA